MFDFHVAQLFDIPTRQLNQLAKRNPTLFPPQLYFRLNEQEYLRLRATDGLPQLRYRNHAHLPHAFTMGGVNMVGLKLRSDFADKVKLSFAVSHPTLSRGPVLQPAKTNRKKTPDEKTN